MIPPAARSRATSWPLTVAIGVIGVAVLACHARVYWPFISDDAFISLRYARRLLDGNGLTWTDGERVEGYSNLLWVLSCAALGAVGMDLVHAARLLGLLGMGATIGAVVYAHRPGGLDAVLPALAGALALALSGPIAVWTIGGLEPPLLAALLAWALVRSYPLIDDDAVSPAAALWPGMLLALLCLTRPDGVLFTVAVCAGVLIAGGGKRQAGCTALSLAILPAGFCLAQLAFRLAYYGEWVPNTALVKLSSTAERLRGGWLYLRDGVIALLPLLGTAAVLSLVSLFDGQRRRRVIVVAAPILLWSVYVVVIGGDIFPARRHLVPIVVGAVLLLANGIASLMHRSTLWRLGTWAAVAGALVLLATQQPGDVENQRARVERWEWEGQVIGTLFRHAFGAQQALLAVDAAGCVPYFSGLPSIDMLGLNDRYLAHHPPATFGRGWVGHELGNGPYVLDREPDLIQFCSPRGGELACFESGLQMQRSPLFQARYLPISFAGSDPFPARSRTWVRREGGRVGIVRRDDAVIIPGFLFATAPTAVARLDAQDRLGVAVTPVQPVMLSGVPLPAGEWRMGLDASEPTVRTRLRSAKRMLLDGVGGGSFTLAGDEPMVDIELSTPPGSVAHVRRVTLTPGAAPSF